MGTEIVSPDNDEAMAELEARKDAAFTAVRTVQRAHRTLKTSSEARVIAERELSQAVAAEKAASERLAQAVERLAGV